MKIARDRVGCVGLVDSARPTDLGHQVDMRGSGPRKDRRAKAQRAARLPSLVGRMTLPFSCPAA